MRTPIISPEYERLTRETRDLERLTADLILERDELLYHVRENIAAEYMMKIGTLDYKVFEARCAVLRVRRKIEIIQAAINRQELYMLPDIERQLDAEFAAYTRALKEKLDEVNKALSRRLDGAPLSSADAAELKRLYAKIVKASHPDLAVDQGAHTLDLFLKAVEAYRRADLETLRALAILLDDSAGDVPKTPETPGALEALARRKEELEAGCENLREDIARIKNTYPYNQKALLSDPARVSARVDELHRLLAAYQEERAELERRVAVMTGGGSGASRE